MPSVVVGHGDDQVASWSKALGVYARALGEVVHAIESAARDAALKPDDFTPKTWRSDAATAEELSTQLETLTRTGRSGTTSTIASGHQSVLVAALRVYQDYLTARMEDVDASLPDEVKQPFRERIEYIDEDLRKTLAGVEPSPSFEAVRRRVAS